MGNDPVLIVVTPSRGRPSQLRRLVEACEHTCGLPFKVVAGLDGDDPALDGYMSWTHPSLVKIVGKGRNSLSGWSNRLASSYISEADFFASLGDDHVPRTRNWDVKLVSAIEDMGGTGFAYGNDLAMNERLPTAWVVSADVVYALGWLCYPGTSHYMVDNVTKDLGSQAGCLAHVPEVVVEHLHHTTGKAACDITYADAGGFSTSHPDYRAYLDWRDNRMSQDVSVLKWLISE